MVFRRRRLERWSDLGVRGAGLHTQSLVEILPHQFLEGVVALDRAGERGALKVLLEME